MLLLCVIRQITEPSKLMLGQRPFTLCTDAQGAPQHLIVTQGDLN